MSRKERRLTDRFIAFSDTGEQFTVLQYTTYIEAGDQWIEGLKDLITTDGQRVNCIEDGAVYQIVDDPMITIRRRRS